MNEISIFLQIWGVFKNVSSQKLYLLQQKWLMNETLIFFEIGVFK